jgi:hypothetical protein
MHFRDYGAIVRTSRECSQCKRTHSIWSLRDSIYGCVECFYVYRFEDEQDVTEEEYEDTRQILKTILSVLATLQHHEAESMRFC